MWSTCGEGSQASVAAANGGREAGYVLLDDLLVDPGISVGNYQIASCRQAVRVLEAGPGGDDVARLAAEALAAELNRSAGSEDCEAADHVVVIARLLLESIGYQGPGRYGLEAVDRPGRIREAVRLLASYNQGMLCTAP